MNKNSIRLRFFSALAVVLCGGFFGAPSVSADTITYLEEGTPAKESSLTGTIDQVTKDGVVIKDRAEIATTVSANRILSTQYDDEPMALRVIRTAIASSQYEDAVTQSEAIPAAELSSARPFVAQDAAYCKAFAKAQLALSGSRDVSLSAAGTELIAFIGRYPDSWHFYEANALIGRMLTKMGKYGDAKKYFETLGSAPWDDMKFVGKIALGNILLDEKDVAGAKAAFTEVADAKADAPASADQKSFARIGLARIMAAEGDSAGAQKLFGELTDQSNSENPLLQATLYNAIGTLAAAENRNKDAIMAFLHVDLLFASARMEHIEALKNLAVLWKKEMREDRAAEAKAQLREKYGITE